jgi:hypothetical protein
MRWFYDTLFGKQFRLVAILMSPLRMHFRSSYISWEGNKVADTLANHETSLFEQEWWDTPPPFSFVIL